MLSQSYLPDIRRKRAEPLPGILGYPTLCWFLIQDDSAKTAYQAVGGNFTLTSPVGPEKAFGIELANPTTTDKSGTVSATSTTTPTGAGTPSASYTPPSSTFPPSSSSLNTGAKAGIGASIAVLALIITTLYLHLLIIRRKLKRAENSIFGLSTKIQTRTHDHVMEQQRHKPGLPGIGAPPVFEASSQIVEREIGAGRSAQDEEGDGRVEPDLELVSRSRRTRLDLQRKKGRCEIVMAVE